MAKVGLTQFERYTTWATFPGVSIGDQISFTDYVSDRAYYQVKATIKTTGISIDELVRGPDWATSHIYMQIYKIG